MLWLSHETPQKKPPWSQFSDAITQGFFIVLQVCKQEMLCSIQLSNDTMGEGERWEHTLQGVFKRKNHKQRVICLGITGLGKGIFGSNSRWDFCNFPQNFLVIVKKYFLFSFWLDALKSLGSQVIFRMVVVFLWIYRYKWWCSWGWKPARLDSHKDGDWV